MSNMPTNNQFSQNIVGMEGNSSSFFQGDRIGQMVQLLTIEDLISLGIWKQIVTHSTSIPAEHTIMTPIMAWLPFTIFVHNSFYDNYDFSSLLILHI